MRRLLLTLASALALPSALPSALRAQARDEQRGSPEVRKLVIDGAERMRCARAAPTHVKEGGIVILDNSEWYRNSCAFLRDAGFFQMDFCGFTPLNSFTAMTSIFTKTPVSFPYKQRRESWTPIGGKALNRARPDDT